MRAFVFAATCMLLVPGNATAQASLQEFLTQSLGVPADKVRALMGGEVVVQLLGGQDDIEIATFGAFTVAAPAADVMAHLSRQARAGSGEGIKTAIVLGTPPQLSQLDAFPFSDDDLKELRECHAGDCKVKLPDVAMERLQGFDWSASDARAGAAEILRELMHGYATSYLQGGNGALAVYHDKKVQGSVHDGLVALFDESPYLFQFAPRFREHLLDYPRSSLEGSSDDLLWTVQDLGIRPITALTHVVTQTRSDPNGLKGLIAGKQIYASHYFLAALGLTAVLEEATPSGSRTVVLEVNRYRFDDKLGRLQRIAVRGRLSDFVKNGLTHQKAALGH